MGTIFRDAFPTGWIPSDDEINGRETGLVRMDNLTLEEKGVLAIMRGQTYADGVTYAGDVKQLFSTTFPGGKARYAVDGTIIYRNGSAVLTGGSFRAALGTGWGHAFLFMGDKKRKDDGSSVSDLGIAAPSVPSVSKWQNYNDFSGTGTTVCVESKTGSFVSIFPPTIDSNEDSNKGIIGLSFPTPYDCLNTWNLVAKGTDDDIFSVNAGGTEPEKIKKFRVEFYLSNTGGTVSSDYYWYEWENINLTPSAPAAYRVKRKDFNREGVDNTLDWTKVSKIHFIFQVDSYAAAMAIGLPQFTGSSLGTNTGVYEYKVVNVYRSDSLLETGLPSDAVRVELQTAYTWVTPAAFPVGVNEAWIYRRSENTDTYYKVGEITSASPFVDIYTDADVLARNERLETLFAELVPDNVISVIGPYFGRLIYLTPSNIYISFPNNPGLVDSRYTIRASSNGAETNLFLAKIAEGILYLGTTNEIYNVAGTFLVNDLDGTIDVDIKPIGIKQPPVDYAYSVYQGSLIYLSADGWRMLAGSSQDVLTGELNRLFSGQSCHGIAPMVVPNRGSSVVSCAIANNKFYGSHETSGGSRILIVYDFLLKYWSYYNGISNLNNPAALFTEEDGLLIASTMSYGDRKVRILETGTSLASGANRSFFMRTVYMNGGMPNRRKDSLMLRLKADTGGSNVIVRIRGRQQDGTVVTASTTLNTSAANDFFYDIYSGVGLVKEYQVELQGDSVAAFKLYELQIDFQERPAQLKSLRIEPTDFGVAGRKRLQEIPMLIDTLANNVTFTPLLDGGALTPVTFNCNEKLMQRWLSVSDTVGYMIGGLLQASNGVFEFYDLVKPSKIEVLPDPVLREYGNYENFGTSARKRFKQVARVIDTRGQNVLGQVFIDGVGGDIFTINTSRKETFIYTFDEPTVGIELKINLGADTTTPFEDYGWNLEECVYEKLPGLAQAITLENTNWGIAARKRVGNIPFMIDTFGHNVTYTPIVDGTPQAPVTLNSDGKRTIVTFHDPELKGTDYGGTLIGAYDFEFYGMLTPKNIEILPELSKKLVIPNTNFGTAAKKRVRTIPLVIDTMGHPVTFTPRVDGGNTPPTTITTYEKRTFLTWFEQDVFGIDYGGVLEGAYPFEFYEMVKPEIVQFMPVAKRLDQIGPIRFNRTGKVRGARIRLFANSTDDITVRVYSNDVVIHTTTFEPTSGVEKVYNVEFPMGVNPEICRVELQSPVEFHRIAVELKVRVEGSATEVQYVRFDDGDYPYPERR